MQDDKAFEFNATWRDYAPIAFTNLLLIIVTLGGYRFWAKTRERRFLWSRTRFIDEQLEWTGTGVELMIGFALAFVLFGIPFIFINFGAQALILRGHATLVGIIFLFLYPWLFFLIGVARFRALRYRLSRTLWHGIRGGSDDNGVKYGLHYLWRSIVGWLPLGLMVPWSMTTLWNRRWNAMSFGSERFVATANWRSIMGRFLLFYLTPLFAILVFLVSWMFGSVLGGQGAGWALTMLIAPLALYVMFGFLALGFYAAYFREAAGQTEWAGLRFSFDAETSDWLKFTLGTIGLLIITLGVATIFLGYRNWRFMTDHMQAYGEIDLERLAQSTTRAPRQGEGLLDAFDMGAI